MRWTWMRERWRGGSAPEDPDRGSAVVEFIGLGLLLLVPVIYLVVTVVVDMFRGRKAAALGASAVQ